MKSNWFTKAVLVLLFCSLWAAISTVFWFFPSLLTKMRPHAAELMVLLVCLVFGTGATVAIVKVRTLGPYVPELLVLIVGLITGLISAVMLDNKAIAVIAVLIAFLLSVSTFSLKREIGERVAAVSKLHVAQSQIHNSRWRDDANERIQELEMEISGWANGQRTIPHERSIPYQIQLLASASRSVDAIHIALTDKALALWDRKSGKFSALVEAHERLPSSVKKRRIMVLDDNDPRMVTKTNGSRILNDPTAVRVCQHQVGEPPEGLGVELRLLWKSHLGRVDNDYPRDLLLVDREEAVVLTVRDDSIHADGHQKYETQAYVESTPVRVHQRRFEAYWAVATPVRFALRLNKPSETPDTIPAGGVRIEGE